MEEERLCRTMLQHFCSLALMLVIPSAGFFFLLSYEITPKVKKVLQVITVCERHTDYCNKGG